MHHLLIYEYVEGMAERRGPHREAHLDQVRQQRQAGHLTMAGALGDPEPTGAAFVFEGRTPEQIEAFVAADPYVQAGLVPSHRVEVWKLV